MDLENTKGSLLSGLHFDLQMNPVIRSVLEDAGITPATASEFPDLATWRQQVADYGLSTSIIPTSYDAMVRIEDRHIPLQDAEIKLRLRCYYPLQVEGPLPVFYWMHGGGMMGGTPEQDDGQMKQIAVEARVLVISVDYRVAPEYPFPIPLNDCYAGLRWVTDHAELWNIDINRIAVGGASGGGGLAASLTLKIKRDGGPKLVHQSLTYPMLDDRNETNSSHQITSLGLWDRSFNLFGWQAYLGTDQDKDIVPALAVPAREPDLSGLPSAFIAVGSLDLFRDEDIEYAIRLMEAGVSTELHFYPGAVHGFDWYIPKEKMTISFLEKRINALRLALESSKTAINN